MYRGYFLRTAHLSAFLSVAFFVPVLFTVLVLLPAPATAARAFLSLLIRIYFGAIRPAL
jgi:hypothetical protein